jgi:pimeloyl-ACP methyl ester carboxylesterase
MEKAETTVAGVRSPVLRAGDPRSAEAVVFVHGNPGSSNDWLDLTRHLEPLCRTFAADMPGFGRADKPRDFDFTVTGYATHLGRLIEAEGIRRVHLVLHDFGGPWGLAWAAGHIDQVASVTLINIGILRNYRWHYMARIWQTPLLGELAMAATTRTGMRLALRHGNPRGLPDAYIDEMFSNYDAGTRRAVLKLYRHSADIGGTAEDWIARLAPARLPALVVWGDGDPYVSADFAEAQRDYFEVHRVLRLPRSGHWPMIDDPVAVHDAVASFLVSRIG